MPYWSPFSASHWKYAIYDLGYGLAPFRRQAIAQINDGQAISNLNLQLPGDILWRHGQSKRSPCVMGMAQAV